MSLELELNVTQRMADVADIQADLRDHFKATEVDVHSRDGSGAGSEVHLTFEGFQSVDDAYDRMAEVDYEVRSHNGIGKVRSGVNVPLEESDDRPMAWVNATYFAEGDK